MSDETISIYYQPAYEINGLTIYHKIIVYKDSNDNYFGADGIPLSAQGVGASAALGVLAGSGYHGVTFAAAAVASLINHPVDTRITSYGSSLPPGMDQMAHHEVIEQADLSVYWTSIQETMNTLDGNFAYLIFTQNCNTVVDTAIDLAGLSLPAEDGNYFAPGSGHDFNIAVPVSAQDVSDAIDYAKTTLDAMIQESIEGAEAIRQATGEALRSLGQVIYQILPEDATMLLDGLQDYIDGATPAHRAEIEGICEYMLRDDIGLQEEEGDNLRDWAKDVWDWLKAALGISSPLVLDLSENGTGVELVAQDSSSAVYFDWNGDGFATASGWVTANAGFLVYDEDESGVIENGTEMFGDQTGFANGFLALANYDSNTDDVIDDSDTIWDDLRVWVDENGNGYSEDDELHTLDELLITEIDLDYSTVDYQIAGNNVYQESTFTMDSETRDVLDVYFTTDTMNTGYVGDIDLDMSVFELPAVRGYGQLPQMSLALMLDNDTEDSDSLISLMTGLADVDYETLGVDDDPMPFYAAVEKVMLRWAGVDDVVSDSRGGWIDARYLEFVEKITGQDFTQLGGGDDPLAGPAPVIMEAWGIAHQAIAARLAYQIMDGHELFDDAPLYDPVTDAFGDSTGVDFDALETFLTHTDYLDHLTAARLAVSWTEEIIGFDNLTTQEKADFEDLLPQNVTLDALLADVQYASTSATGYLYGDANDNFMVTPSTTEETVQNFSAGAGNDLLISGSATQSVYAYDGNDVMIAGTGRQTLLGYDGDDLYVFAPGTGQMDGSYYNTIQESASNGTDTLRITGGVEADDVYAWTTSNGYLYVQYTDTDFVRATASATGGASRVGERLEKIVFDDETEWDLTTGLMLHNNDTSRTFYGSTGDDVMIAGGGADKLYGKAGDDILESGGGSADWLYGDAGADTFRFMEDTAYDALDLIKDFDAGEGDAIDIADLLTGYNPLSDTISDFVSLSESGGHTTLAVDKDGTGGTYSFTDVARIDSTTGLDLNDMITNGELLIA